MKGGRKSDRERRKELKCKEGGSCVHEIEQLIIMRSLHIKRAKITKIQQ
jgi:hypothetical protein